MKRKALAGLIPVAIVAVLAIPAITGTGGVDSGRTGLAVSPASATPLSAFAFSFTAPRASGRQGELQTYYTLSVEGPARTGCAGVHFAQLPATTRDESVRVSLGPAQLGRPWCRGTFTARVAEYARPDCSAGKVCPQFIRLVAVIGRAAFKVSG